MFPTKKLVLFDLDGTLAPSKGAISSSMAEALHLLLQKSHVAVITGGKWDQIKKQVIDNLAESSREYFHRLHILPTAGTRYYAHDNDWKEIYAESIHPNEIQRIIDTINREIQGEYEMSALHGDLIEDRGSQVTISALGQLAPLHLKEKFDPDQSIRKRIVVKLQPHLEEYDIKIGGATSIDITKKGMDKGFGITKIKDILGLSHDELIYVGDAIFEGGNDYPAKVMGLYCVSVTSPEDTEGHIRRWVE